MNIRALAAGPILIALLLTVAVSIVYVANSPVTDAYSSANKGMDGTSKLVDQGFQTINADFAQNLSSSNPPALLLILSPTLQFNAADAEAIQLFVTKGGLLLLADDSGTGNTLLQLLNIPIRFDGRLLIDPFFYTTQPTYPNIVNISNSSLTINVNQLLAHHATVLNIPQSSFVTVLASSTQFSLLANPNGPQNATQRGPFPVLAEIKIGNGLLVVFSSPASFTNDLLDAADNSILLSDIANAESQMASNALLLLDQTHLIPTLATQTKLATRNLLDGIVDGQLGLGQQLILVATAVTILAGRFMFRRPRIEPETVEPDNDGTRLDLQAAKQKHPNWDIARLDYIAKELRSSMRWRKFVED